MSQTFGGDVSVVRCRGHHDRAYSTSGNAFGRLLTSPASLAPRSPSTSSGRIYRRRFAGVPEARKGGIVMTRLCSRTDGCRGLRAHGSRSGAPRGGRRRRRASARSPAGPPADRRRRRLPGRRRSDDAGARRRRRRLPGGAGPTTARRSSTTATAPQAPAGTSTPRASRATARSSTRRPSR